MHFSQWVMLSYMKSPLLDSLHFAVTHVTDATRTLLFLMVGWENRTYSTYIIYIVQGSNCPTVPRPTFFVEEITAILCEQTRLIDGDKSNVSVDIGLVKYAVKWYLMPPPQ